MKRYFTVFLVLAVCVCLCACGKKNSDSGPNITGNVNGPIAVVPQPSVDVQDTQPEQDIVHSYRELQIVLNDSYESQNQGQFSSDEEMTDIYCEPHSIDKVLGDYNLSESANRFDITLAYVNANTPGLALNTYGTACIYTVSENDYGDGTGVWTIMSAYYISSEHFWEIRFVCNGKSWEELRPLWESYLEQISFVAN